ncbi:MAG: bifunctional glutamate N-acetyltransferase/amino-acid acetyltransferase ArgJ [Planctomycetota bacterium]
MPLQFPTGFRGAGVHCGIKSDPAREDLSLIVSDRPSVAVGVYTKNQVRAAAVEWDAQHTPCSDARVVVINSGNANACTGNVGAKDTAQMASLAATAAGCDTDQALVLSTGIIGEHLPMDKIEAGISDVAQKLDDGEAALVAAARGMMTTDTVHKMRGREIKLDDDTVHVTGIAKGAAMIGPNMATMLAVVMTDACVSQADAQAALSDAVVESFNCISVDGHSSTNDTVLLIANGAAGDTVGDKAGKTPIAGRALDHFRATVLEVCEDLAQAIPADGEGASHLITIEVHGCRDRSEATQIAKTIANSPLVKTAIAGADPNWGRIVSAAGYAGVDFDASQVTLLINGLLLYEHGVPVDFDDEAVSASIRDNRDCGIVVIFSEGAASARFWTTDLTAEYVRLNADYHT